MFNTISRKRTLEFQGARCRICPWWAHSINTSNGNWFPIGLPYLEKLIYELMEG